MLTTCYITIDTEYEFSFTRRMGSSSRRGNFMRSIACKTPSGEAGIFYQMSVLGEYGLKAIFFVDPMPALVWGTAAIEDIVAPIVEHGHDVQLHMHTEWLELAGGASPVRGRTGTNIKDFTFDEQCALLAYARNVITAAGAQPPIAFRAGNYGASDATLRALAAVGMRYDTSFCPGIPTSPCDISLTPANHAPVHHCGVIEVPIGCIANWGQSLRHAQLTALSAAEMGAAVKHSKAHNVDYFTLVSHSFELLSRDRARINRLVRHRFEALCNNLAGMSGMSTGTYAVHPPVADSGQHPAKDVILPFNPVRTGLRVVEQFVGNLFYGRQ